MITAISLLVIGLLAIFLEFFLPGGILGMIGAFFVLASIISFAADSDSFILTVAYIIIVSVAVGLLIKFALWRIQHGKLGSTVYSNSDQEGYTASAWDTTLVGKDGVVSTDLKPCGHVTIASKKYSAISQSGYITKGDPIVVVGGEGDTLIVKKLTQGN
ncbi:MAG: NfeD family protein [Chlamydiota bacterium]|nr:NfeD family protein [Chlamydiota bacterium]